MFLGTIRYIEPHFVQYDELGEEMARGHIRLYWKQYIYLESRVKYNFEIIFSKFKYKIS